MPLVKSSSREAVSENIRRERAAGKPEKQAVAIALDVQRRAKHRRHGMPENSSHAPGNEIGRGESGTRQRNKMGRGEGAMEGGSFGVGSIPGTQISRNHGEHMKHDGVQLGDHERSGPPGISMGGDHMNATAHSWHGPHHHGKR